MALTFQYAGYTLEDIFNRSEGTEHQAAIDAGLLDFFGKNADSEGWRTAFEKRSGRELGDVLKDEGRINKNTPLIINGEAYRLVSAFDFKEEGVSKEDLEGLKAEFGNQYMLLPYYEPRGVSEPVIQDCLYFMTVSSLRFFRCLRFFSEGRYVKGELDKANNEHSIRKERIKTWLRSYYSNKMVPGVSIDLGKSHPAHPALERLIDIIAQEIYIGFNEQYQLMATGNPPEVMQQRLDDINKNLPARLVGIQQLEKELDQVKIFIEHETKKPWNVVVRQGELAEDEADKSMHYKEYKEFEAKLDAARREYHQLKLRRLSLVVGMLGVSSIERIIMNHEILENRQNPEDFKEPYMVSVRRSETLFGGCEEITRDSGLDMRKDIHIDRNDISRILYELASESFKGAAVQLFRETKGAVKYVDYFAKATSVGDSGVAEFSLTKFREEQYKNLRFLVFDNRVDKVANCGGSVYLAERIALEALSSLSEQGMPDFEVNENTRLVIFPPPPFEDLPAYQESLKGKKMQELLAETFTRALGVITISEASSKDFKEALDIYRAAKKELNKKEEELTRTQSFVFIRKDIALIDEMIDAVRFATKGKRDINASLLLIRAMHHKDANLWAADEKNLQSGPESRILRDVNFIRAC